MAQAGFFRAMASSLPLPVPPRTPTPPLDEQPPVIPEPRSQEYNSSRLSPLVDTFPILRSPSDMGSQDRLSPTKAAFGPSAVEVAAQNASNDDGPFNFQTVTMAKSPVVKSVCSKFIGYERTFTETLRNGKYRISVNDVDTSTNIVASRIRSSSNLLLEHLSLYQIRCRSPRSKNAEQVCRKTRRRGFGGAYATCSWRPIRFGAPRGLWP